jgi:Zn-dependent M28 family amino/carboxypeptidase
MASKLRACLLGVVVALLLVACGGDASSKPGAAATATEAAPDAAVTAQASSTSSTLPQRTDPDPARTLQHLQMLAGTIGSRPATSDNERRAADYIKQQLEAAGYKVSVEQFDVQATLGGSATLHTSDTSTVDASPLNGSPNGTASGELVAAALGRTSDFSSVPAAGNVALLDRGEITFAEKVRNAQAAGAVAVIVVNNEPGPFRGDLGSEPARIPAVSVAQESRAALVAAARAGDAVSIEVQTNRVSGTSQNVIGQPSDKPCTAYLGAHYDSVPAGPGANDNASGTSLMLELARARRVDGLCVIAFGAEEVGLFGSKAYVRDLDVGNAVFMMNFDMVAKLTGAAFIGTEALTAQAARVASTHGIDAQTMTSFGPGTSSDYASFQQAGVPVLMFYSGNDQFIHTAQDDLQNVSQADLGKLLDVAVEVLDQLLAA